LAAQRQLLAAADREVRRADAEDGLPRTTERRQALGVDRVERQVEGAAAQRAAQPPVLAGPLGLEEVHGRAADEAGDEQVGGTAVEERLQAQHAGGGLDLALDGGRVDLLLA